MTEAKIKKALELSALTDGRVYLKAIDLAGFKSFADLTHIELSDGVNVVIAPSGCGKSNLLKAVTWVLLSVEWNFEKDVILFRGTQSRPAADSAEVTLTFGNAENAADDVVLKRCFSRNEEQAYFVNGEKMADWSAFSTKIKSLVLSEIALIDDFDKDAGGKIAEEIAADLEAERRGKQVLVVLDDKSVIAAVKPARIIGLTMEDSGVLTTCNLQFE